jgi:rsbT co-antagonist protein RsbR
MANKGTGPNLALIGKELEECKKQLEIYHTSSMDLAIGVSEIFGVLSGVAAGDFSVRVGEATLSSAEELVAKLGNVINRTIAKIQQGAEKARRDQEKMEAVLDAVPDPMFTMDPGMTVTSFNQAASKLSGLAAKDAIGRKCHDVFKTNRCGNEKCMLRLVMKEGKALINQDVKARDASDQEVDCVASAAAITNVGGEFLGGIEIIRNVTEMKQQHMRIDEYHESSMELAMGMSECFSVLSEVRKGNLEARVGEMALSSSDELMASLAKGVNDTIGIQVELIQRQQDAIQELSTPILQLWDDILVLPIIGVVDSRRSVEIMERVLSTIIEKHTKFIIMDITGVEVVDTKTADHFIKVIQATELIGSTCILTGIQPSVAQTLVEIGVDLSSIITLQDLSDGLKECLRQLDSLKAAGELATSQPRIGDARRNVKDSD